MTLISVGMPVRNSAGTVGRAIESILAQSHNEVEIIISDNCSTDETLQICLEFARLDPRVRVVSQSEDIGMLENFWHVLKEAEGEFFMWAAGDDVRPPDCLVNLKAPLEGHLEVVATFGNALTFGNTLSLGTRDIDRLVTVPKSLGLPDSLAASHRNRAIFHKFPSIPMAFYGLFRREIIMGIVPRLVSQLVYVEGHETPFLSAVSLRGPIVHVPELSLLYQTGSNWNQEKAEKKEMVGKITTILLRQVAQSDLGLAGKARLIGTVLTHRWVLIIMTKTGSRVRRILGFPSRYRNQVARIGWVPMRVQARYSGGRTLGGPSN